MEEEIIAAPGSATDAVHRLPVSADFAEADQDFLIDLRHVPQDGVRDLEAQAPRSLAGAQRATIVSHLGARRIADHDVDRDVLHPGTGQPIGPADLAPLFPMELIKQVVSTDREIGIPEEVRDAYRLYRPSPLYRAHRLEQALDTPAHIYYKYEGGSPSGSHKPNTALPQAYYNKAEGVTRMATETGAGQWGSALAFAGLLILSALFAYRDFISDPLGAVLGFSGVALVLFGLTWDLFTGSGWANGHSRRFPRPTRVLLILTNYVLTMTVLGYAALVRDGSTTIYFDPFAQLGDLILGTGLAAAAATSK